MNEPHWYDINIGFNPLPTCDKFKNKERGDKYWAEWMGELTTVIKRTHPNYEPIGVWIKYDDSTELNEYFSFPSGVVTIRTDASWMLGETKVSGQGCFANIAEYLYNTFDDLVITVDGGGYEHII